MAGGGVTGYVEKKNLPLIRKVFAVASGAVLLFVGGRAALFSAVGLDLTAKNAALKNNLEEVLVYDGTVGTGTKLALVVLVWTSTKVLSFNNGCMVLALVPGLLFGGMW